MTKKIPKIRSKSTERGIGVPINSVVRAKCQIKGPENETQPTGYVNFSVCKGEEITPGGPRLVPPGGCEKGGKKVGTKKLHRGGAISDKFYPTDNAKYCWRCDYDGDENYEPVSDTSASSNIHCFKTSAKQTIIGPLPSGYEFEYTPLGHPYRKSEPRLPEFIKKVGSVTPVSVALAFDVPVHVANEWLQSAEMQGLRKHHRKDLWIYAPESVAEIIHKQKEKDIEAANRIEKELRSRKRTPIDDLISPSQTIINNSEELGLVIDIKRQWDAIPKFQDDIKRLDSNLRRATERRISRIAENPEYASPYIAQGDTLNKTIKANCPSIAHHANVTAQYRLLWCMIDDKIRFLRFMHVGDPDYDTGRTH